jgi:hypothetical protein
LVGVKAIVAEERTNCVAIAGKDENAEDGSEKRPDAMTAWI